MPKTMHTITCCYCDAATLVDLARIGKGVLTCDACGARLSSARMESVINKPVPVKRPKHKKVASTATLDPRWRNAPPQRNKPKKSKKKPKRKSFLDRLEDIWDEIEDIID